MIAFASGDYGSNVLDVSSGGDGRPRAADPRKEYASADLDRVFESTWDILRGEGLGEGVYGWHGLLEYERMDRTPAVGGSFNALRAAVLSGPLGLLPSVKVKGQMKAYGQIEGNNLEADMALEIAESNRRTLDAWETPAPMVLWEGMEAMKFGHMVAERVMTDVKGGPDDGLLAIKSLRWLPRSSYQFKVDRAFNVLGYNIATMDAKGSTGWQYMEAEHYPHLTWDAYRNDPRGRSLYRMAHRAWRMLERLWPEVEKGWHQFGTPYLWGNTAPNAQKSVPPAGPDGSPQVGAAPITAERQMTLAMMAMKHGKVAAGPHGSTISVVESAKDSTMVSNAIGILEGQIIRAILLQLRATMEAKHGSKADSETGQDIMGTLIRFVRMWLERWLRSVLIGVNTLNYGPDIARRLTPIVSLSDHQHQDLAGIMSAFAVLFQAGYPAQGQLSYFDEMFGFPQREPGDLRVGPNGLIPDTLPPDPNAPADPNAAPTPAPARSATATGGAA